MRLEICSVIVNFVPSAPSFPFPEWFLLHGSPLVMAIVYLWYTCWSTSVVPLEVLNITSFLLVHHVIYFLEIRDSTIMSSCAGWITELRVPHASGLPALYLLRVFVELTQSLQIPCPTKEKKCKCTPRPAFTLLFSFRFILSVFDLGLLQRWRYLFFCPSISKKHISPKSFLFPLQNLFVSVFFLFGSAGNHIFAIVYTRQML